MTIESLPSFCILHRTAMVGDKIFLILSERFHHSSLNTVRTNFFTALRVVFAAGSLQPV